MSMFTFVYKRVLVSMFLYLYVTVLKLSSLPSHGVEVIPLPSLFLK
jgi:hypothetical protein